MPARSNRLLEALTPELQETILSKSRSVELPAGTMLYGPGDAPSHVYFLLSGVASVVVSVANGGCAEVSMSGTEGLVGAVNLLGPQQPLSRCFMQTGGRALRMPLPDARRLFADSSEFRSRVLEYLQAVLQFNTQVSACNKLHQAAERMARWLLTAGDCGSSDTLPLTQEALSQMLGTRRTTIALVAGQMQRNGLLRYRRGLVMIADRGRLMASACDCYSITRNVYEQLYA